MKPGFIAGPTAESFAAKNAASEDFAAALPPERPLGMPRQNVHGRRQRLRQGATVWSWLAVGLARLTLVIGTGALTAYGIAEMHGVMATGGLTALQWVFLGIFSINFAWVSFTACQAALGFVRLLANDALPRRRQEVSSRFRTAILVPVYNEVAPPVAAALAALSEEMARRAPGRFHVFILSDSNRPQAWISEEAVFAELIKGADENCPIYYRHRTRNTERKAGNIADWVTRWGDGYDAMLVLDADSLMAPETVIALAGRLESDPGLGLIQTLPAIVRGRSLYARLQQFANRCYGPVLGNGLAAWHGRNSNFWGHNAIIRTAAFAEAARLPQLTGKPPFGGTVLSHDFIEAALLRRAGWGVRLDTDLGGSYEDAPPAVSDVISRDRRWCQGNFQHWRFLFARGLTFSTRLHLLSGIMGYLSAPLWFALIAVGVIIAIQAGLTRPEYFTGRALFPTWPVFDSERAIALFAVSMAVVLAPKGLGWLAAMINPRRMLAFSGPLALTFSVATEILLSALYAPILMVAQSNIVREVLTGRDCGWAPQRRGEGETAFAAVLYAHRWQVGIGIGLSALAYPLNPDLFLWLLPVTAGLILAIPLSWASGSARLGALLGRIALLRTPEEHPRRRPEILRAFETQLDRFSTAAAGPLQRLADDPTLRNWHLAQLRNGGAGTFSFDPPLILAQAKLKRAADLAALQAWLTPDETMAFLLNADLVEALDRYRTVGKSRFADHMDVA